MAQEFFFEIPDSSEVKAKLVEAVPSDWHWVDGTLRAPQSLVDLDKVAVGSGFLLSRFHSVNPTLVGEYTEYHKGRKAPDFHAMIVEQRLPGFVTFREAGFDLDISLETAKRVAAGLLLKEYHGGLYFYKGWDYDDKYDNKALCDIRFNPWTGTRLDKPEIDEQPARVKITLYDRNGGILADIEPILTSCKALGLRQYDPSVATPA